LLAGRELAEDFHAVAGGDPARRGGLVG
jgi:hypothetical protein